MGVNANVMANIQNDLAAQADDNVSMPMISIGHIGEIRQKILLNSRLRMKM